MSCRGKLNLPERLLAEKIQAVIDKRKEPLTIPNIQVVEMDDKLLKVMVKALAPNPEQRFESAEQFLEAIEGKI